MGIFRVGVFLIPEQTAKIFLRIPLLINLFIFLIKERLLKNLIKEHTFLYLVTYLFI